MLFNPLFIQPAGQTDASSVAKQSKLSSSSYLFSDIIKIINENTVGGASQNTSNNTVTASDEENIVAGKSNVSLNDILKNLSITSTSDTEDVASNNELNSNSSAVISASGLQALLQKLSTILANANISSSSAKSIANKLLSSSGNSGAEITINLNNLTTSSSSSGLNGDAVNASAQFDVSKSLLDEITSLLSAAESNSTVSNTQQKPAEKSGNTEDKSNITKKAEELAASILNLFQNNNAVVLNIKSGSDEIKIELSKGSSVPAQNNIQDKGITLNNQEQTESSVNTTGQVNVDSASKNQAAGEAVNNAGSSKQGNVNSNPSVDKAKEEILSFFNTKKTTDSTTSPAAVNSSPKTDESDTSAALKPAESFFASVKIASDNKSAGNIVSENNNTGNKNEINPEIQNSGEKVYVKLNSKINLPVTEKSEAAGIAANKAEDTNTTPEIEFPTKRASDGLKALDNLFNTKKLFNAGTQNQEVKNSESVKNNLTDFEYVSSPLSPDKTSASGTLSVNSSNKISDINNISGQVNLEQTAAVTQSQQTTGNETTDAGIQLKTVTGEQAAVQVKNDSASSGGQQKKSSDGNNNQDLKFVNQVSGELFTKQASSVKDNFSAQLNTADNTERTIKITEITKEISNLAQQNSHQSIELMLKPESLGKIKVTVDVSNNQVSAKVVVDSEAVRQIVQNNTLELTNSLNSNGMHLSSLSVNVSGGEQKSYQPFSQKKKSGLYSGSKMIDDDEAGIAAAKSLGYNTYEYLI